MPKTNVGSIMQEHPELLWQGPLAVREQQVLRLLHTTRKEKGRAPTIAELEATLHSAKGRYWLRHLWHGGYVSTSVACADGVALTGRTLANMQLTRKGRDILSSYDRMAREENEDKSSILIALRVDGRRYAEFLEKNHEAVAPYVVGARRYLEADLPPCAVMIPLLPSSSSLFDLLSSEDPPSTQEEPTTKTDKNQDPVTP